jgi:hypothetical protein
MQVNVHVQFTFLAPFPVVWRSLAPGLILHQWPCQFRQFRIYYKAIHGTYCKIHLTLDYFPVKFINLVQARQSLLDFPHPSINTI